MRLADVAHSLHVLSTLCRAFEAAVAASEGDDPLATWKRYISWTEKHAIAAEVKVWQRAKPHMPGRGLSRSLLPSFLVLVAPLSQATLDAC